MYTEEQLKRIAKAKDLFFEATGARIAGVTLGTNENATAEEMAEEMIRAYNSILAGDYEVVHDSDDFGDGPCPSS